MPPDTKTYHKGSTKRIVGLKLYSYNEETDEITVYRILHYKESQKTYKVYNLNTDKIETFYEDEIYDAKRFVVLNPDGFLTFSIVDMNKTNNVKDVMVCLHKRNETVDQLPYAVCRQCMQDIFIEQTILKTTNLTTVGCSVSKESIPAGADFGATLVYERLRWMVITAVYLDDSLDSIAKYIFPGINIKKFDNVLARTKEWSTINLPTTRGFSDTVYDLLKDNRFIHDFRTAFDTLILDFNIDKDLSSSTGYQMFLYKEQLDIFKKQICNNKITMTYIIPYDKEIDLDDIQRNYVLAQSKDNDDIFVIGYDVQLD